MQQKELNLSSCMDGSREVWGGGKGSGLPEKSHVAICFLRNTDTDLSQDQLNPLLFEGGLYDTLCNTLMT